MSDEEHHFESKADAGASKTYPQQAGTIRKNGYVVIKNRPCKSTEEEKAQSQSTPSSAELARLTKSCGLGKRQNQVSFELGFPWFNSLLKGFPSLGVQIQEMNGTCLKFEKPIRDAISRIRFAPESNNLLISSWDSSLRLYDVDSFTLRVEVPSEAALLDCCFQNESVAFTACSDCCVRRYDLDSGTHDTFGNHDDLVSCVEYSAETRQLITAGWDRKIKSWDTRSTNPLECLKTPFAEVESMAVSGCNLMVAVGSSVNIYDLRNFNKSVYAKELFPGFQIRCVRTILNSEGFVAGSIDGRIAVEYLNSCNTGYVFWCHPKSKDGRHHVVPVNDIAFNPFISGAFVTGNHKGYVTTWDAHSKRRLLQLPRYSNSVTSLSYTHGGQLLVVASSYAYREGNETEEPPQIFIHDMDDVCIGSASVGNSKRNDISQDM